MQKIILNEHSIYDIDDICEKIYNCYNWRGSILIICGDDIKAEYGKKLNEIFISNNIESSLLNIKNMENQIHDYDILIDCISFTELSSLEVNKIKMINSSNKTIISIDINSGLDRINGLHKEICIKSDITISFNYYPGLFLGHAKDYIKEIINLNILDANDSAYLLDISDFTNIFKKRANHSNKKTNGYVAIIGGTLEYSGAVKLANLGLSSMKSGSGLARIIVPKSLSSMMLPNMLEETLYLIDDNDGHMIYKKEQIDEALVGIDAISIGSGWGISEDNKQILEYILKNYSLPLIIDADGLNNLNNIDINILHGTKCKVVLTPHLKEFSRLCNISIAEIERDIVKISKKYAKEKGLILLLKGATTIITDGEIVYLVNKGCSGMAKAGSGDLFTGIILGIIGYSGVSLINVSCGAFINGLAGELANTKINEYSMIPSDTAKSIPEAIQMIIDN